ncbi:MAG: hypothetical protein CTY23_10085 [Methylomonas sp.]|nr:MAG: hypothetical protein CTY23_10085 [Methylomonas sp.]
MTETHSMIAALDRWLALLNRSVLVPTVSVGTHTGGHTPQSAESGMHSHAERGNENWRWTRGFPSR